MRHERLPEKLSRIADILRRASTSLESPLLSPLGKHRALVSAQQALACCLQSLDEGVAESLVNEWLLPEDAASLSSAPRTPPSALRLAVMRRCVEAGLSVNLGEARRLLERARSVSGRSHFFERPRFVTIPAATPSTHHAPRLFDLHLSADSAKTALDRAESLRNENRSGAGSLLFCSHGPELWSARWLPPLELDRWRAANVWDAAPFDASPPLAPLAAAFDRATADSVAEEAGFGAIVWMGGRHDIQVGFLQDASLVATGHDDRGEPWLRRGWALSDVLPEPPRAGAGGG